MKFQIGFCFLCLWNVVDLTDEVTSVLSDKQAIQDSKVFLKETKKFTDKQLDLVFVLDRSKSITTSGWQNVLSFLHSFLEHFTVDSDNTRIAVISFSTNATIEINDLKTGKENKCSIISKFRKYLRMKVPFGYTATHDALIKAKEILLEDSRSSAKKVVIVMTDGRSNLGPPPIRASVELRSLRWSRWDGRKDGPQLEIFTFGVHQTDILELESISSPLPNHTFHIESFSQFYDIARSLYNDEQDESWDMINKSVCTTTCHADAVCMCGSKLGQYLCVCSLGYEGTGDNCQPCDKGYYKDSTVPYPCKPCPQNMTTEYTGSTDIRSCVCKLGFYKDGDDCTYRTCSESPEIKKGYKFNINGMVHDEVSPTGQDCLNTPGTSCHYKCNIGFRLTGNPGLICQANGIWKGSVPECEIVDCGDLKYHDQVVQHGTVNYINTTTTYQSVLNTTCNKGWILFGDSIRTCTKFGVWSGTKATCVESRCQPLRLTEGIELFPFNCSTELQYPGNICRYRCKRGYRLSGPDRLVCSDIGSWSGTTATECTDIEAPRITCPEDITVPLTTSNIAIVNWNTQKPMNDDNSGETRLRITGLENNPANLTIGHYSVRYIVEDKAGNSDSCTRNIHVVERMAKLIYCPRNITNRAVTGSSMRVYWQKPVFVDNNGNQVEYQCSRINGSVFQLGSYNIHCTVLTTETIHNSPSCTFSILLERKQCELPPAPYHGSLSCNTGSDALMICTVKCNIGYDFYYTPQTHYKCDLSGNWILQTPGQFWPDCSRKYYPRRAKMRGLAEFFYYNGKCEENKRIIVDKFTRLVQKRSWEICGEASCTVSNVSVNCGLLSRRRRAADRSQVLPDPLTDVKGKTDPNFGSFDIFSIKSHNVDFEKGDEENTDAAVLVNTPTSHAYQTTSESLPTKSEIVRGDITTNTVAERTTSDEENVITEEGIYESSQSVTEDPMVSMNSQSVSWEDTTSVHEDKDTASASVTYTTLTSPEYTNNDPYTVDANLTDSALQEYSGDHNGSVSLNFLIENEITKTNVTQMDLEQIIDLLWNVFDELQLSNFSIEKPDGDMILIPQNLDLEEPSAVGCDMGYIPVLDIIEQCVGCPRGTKMINESCQQCPVSFYQDENAQVECKECPDGHTTMQNGSVSFENCTGPCPVGSVSITGYKPCKPCDNNTYQDEIGQTNCKECPNNTGTVGVGLTQLDDCTDPSVKIPCLGINTSCPNCNDSFCLNGGQCIPVGEDIACYCPVGYTGSRCELFYDFCQSNPCFNNGTCLQDAGGYKCACHGHFHGNQCETYINPCEKIPCRNGGSCLNEGNGLFQCYCLHNFTGEVCVVKLDYCESNPCLNGTCNNNEYGYYCNCTSGYAGRYCDAAINYTCRHVQCQNNGRCIDGQNGPRCLCVQGFTGILCEVNVNDCLSSPCKNNAVCIDGDGEYICRCMTGYSGRHCQEVTSEQFDLQLDNNLGIGYVRYHPFHESKITEFTIFLWFRSYQKDVGVLLSYTIRDSNEEFDDVILVEQKYNILTFSVMHSNVFIPIYLPSRQWHHIILDWSSKYGVWHIYVNGTITANGFKLAPGMVLTARGSLTLGLKENYYGGTKNIWTAFTGEISQFNMYGFIIPENEIHTVYNNSSCNAEFGNLIAWSDSFKGIHGAVTVRNTSHCLDINECMEGVRCNDNRICQDRLNGYDCVCGSGFTGINCEPVDECLHRYCFNEGHCEDGYGIHDANCICQKGYSGKFCEVQENLACSNSTCINGICEGNECKCQRDWRGGNCGVFYKSGCELSPCLTNSTCIPDIFSVEGFRCICPESDIPYDKNCKPLPCIFSPCLNNGICYGNYDASFTCDCKEGFSGTHCQTVTIVKDNKSASECESNSCNSNGICISNNANIYCKCHNDFTGKWCESSLYSSTSVDGVTTKDEKIIIYTCLSILIVIITATCFIILCYWIRRRRKYSTKHRRLLPVLNNESIGMSILHNPVFTMDDDDDDEDVDLTRQRTASGTYENPYAEPGDIPYIDDFIDIKNNQSKAKQCNIQKAVERKNSKSSYTSNRSSSKSFKKLDGGYLQPIFTKNQLENVSGSEKDKKVLLPSSQKSFKVNNEPEYVPANPPEYENQHKDKAPLVSSSKQLLRSESNPAYVNEPSDKIEDPCARLQNIIDSKPSHKSSHANRLLNKMVKTDDCSPSRTLETINIANPIYDDSTPYLRVVEPKPGEFPPYKSKHFDIAPSTRKLPPIPVAK